MKEKTKKNIYTAFTGEAKAYFRLLAYAEKADEEKVPQIALLFRAIAEAERVHAMLQLNLVKDYLTNQNIKRRFTGHARSPLLAQTAPGDHAVFTFYYFHHWHRNRLHPAQIHSN